MKYFLLIVFFSLFLMSADATKASKELGVYNDYATALEKAKTKKGLMVLVVVWNPCSACDKLVKNTLLNVEVNKKLQEYTTVILDYKAPMPKQFKVEMAPKIFYIDPQTEEAVGENMGVLSVETIMEDLKEAKEDLE